MSPLTLINYRDIGFGVHLINVLVKQMLRTNVEMAHIFYQIILSTPLFVSVGGHDSQEDANSAMELMIWKLKDDIKNEKRK